MLYLNSILSWINNQFVDKNIPKIIHQTAPANTEDWHDIWFTCQKSWKRIYPNYSYVLWNDETMDTFMKNTYPEYYELYSNYPNKIMKIDAARYFILYTYGGIYADMDYEVCRDFMHLVPQNMVSVCESPYKENENCQNALMISPKGHPFWKRVFKELVRSKNNNIIISVAGPKVIDRAMQGRNDVHILPYQHFNPHKNGNEIQSDDRNIYTKHYGTFVWENY